ncbi:hypothetical protein [Streptococcus infantis]|jgi:hypothetical protein|uniref:hypothetical protein n=1 Tax=Streptococcus infantis TaxID=68892 RepID=UPI001CBBDC80|nr:hypothetical protein [Streptococcus infantis]MBZ2120829.1 hypothetical protein [Streptococcus infantis]MBZ2122647.1 hypothetical protein [Streptococcus infantis]MBZ2126424.1 hypothetical protein [Streptococcus infantis]
MEGYHGTKPESVNAILGQQHFECTSFEITGDWVIKSGQSLPNDLGVGLYMFVDDPPNGYQGLENAKKYARVYRNSNKKIGVIKFKIKSDNLTILDLNNPTTTKNFNEYKDKYYQKLKNSLGGFKRNNSFHRYNLDGVFLEHLLRYNKSYTEVDVVTCKTYTPPTPDKPISPVPNGKEICLRTLTLIDWTVTKEKYNGY